MIRKSWSKLSFVVSSFTRLSGMLFAASVILSTHVAANDCMTPVGMTRELIRSSHNYTGFAGAAGVPAFLEAVQSEYAGTVVMVKKGHGWTAFIPQEREDSVGTFVGKNADVYIFTMFDTEGPGSSWTLFHSNNGFATGHCTDIPFPHELNRPEWRGELLELVDFDIAPNGKGVIVGSSPVEGTGSSKTWWFRYTTRDGGRTWSRPRRLRTMPDRQRGSVMQVAVRNIPSLYRKLRVSIRAD